MAYNRHVCRDIEINVIFKVAALTVGRSKVFLRVVRLRYIFTVHISTGSPAGNLSTNGGGSCSWAAYTAASMHMCSIAGNCHAYA